MIYFPEPHFVTTFSAKNLLCQIKTNNKIRVNCVNLSFVVTELVAGSSNQDKLLENIGDFQAKFVQCTV